MVCDVQNWLLGIVLYLSSMGCFSVLQAQSQDLSSDRGFHSSIQYIQSVRTDDTRSNRLSQYGLGYDLSYFFEDSWTINLRSSLRNWSDRKKLIWPLTVGPGYRFNLGGEQSIMPFVGIGPGLAVGNDYAGIFAHAELGLKAELFSIGSSQVFVGTVYSISMLFHPSDLQFLDFMIGLRF